MTAPDPIREALYTLAGLSERYHGLVREAEEALNQLECVAAAHPDAASREKLVQISKARAGRRIMRDLGQRPD